MDSRRAVRIVVIGVGAGLLARGAFTVLPSPWDTLANTSALWGLVGAGAARAARTRGAMAAGAGASALLFMVLTFAATAPSTTAREVVLWIVAGLAAGAAFGLAGSRAPSNLAMGFMSGVLVGEAFYGLVLIGGPHWWVEVTIGLLLAARARRPVVAATLAAALMLALFGAYLLYDAIAAA